MNFRATALATTALVAIAAAPAEAGQYMGKVNLGVGYAWEDYSDGGESSSDFDLNYTTIHGSASVNVPYSDRVNLQFDVNGAASMDEKWDCDSSTCGSSYEGFGVGFHINYKDPGMGGLGVFATVGRMDVGSSVTYDAVFYAAGLEGEYYCNAWTLSAQVGYADSDSTVWGVVKNAGFARAGVAYYPSSRLKLAAAVGYLNGETWHTNASDLDEWNWNFSVEHMFGKSIPVSTYIEYKGQSLEEWQNPVGEIDRHEVRAGVRFYFGAGDDLMKADREGASFESPDIMTWGRHYY